jgi:hypothetical protein
LEGGRKTGRTLHTRIDEIAYAFSFKRIKSQISLPCKRSGQADTDTWNLDSVYIDRPVKQDADPISLAEFLLPMKITPLDFAITNDFLSSLTDDERLFLNGLTAGYSKKEISKRNSIDKSQLLFLRKSLQQKAVAYL